jgi:hypothetical protein
MLYTPIECFQRSRQLTDLAPTVELYEVDVDSSITQRISIETDKFSPSPNSEIDFDSDSCANLFSAYF